MLASLVVRFSCTDFLQLHLWRWSPQDYAVSYQFEFLAFKVIISPIDLSDYCFFQASKNLIYYILLCSQFCIFWKKFWWSFLLSDIESVQFTMLLPESGCFEVYKLPSGFCTNHHIQVTGRTICRDKNKQLRCKLIPLYKIRKFLVPRLVCVVLKWTQASVTLLYKQCLLCLPGVWLLLPDPAAL